MAQIEDLLKQATDTWGEDSQMLLAIEECGELIAVLSQYMRGRKTKEEVAEEVADVSLMVRQLRLLFGWDTVNVIEIKKIKRLKMRLEQCDINGIGTATQTQQAHAAEADNSAPIGARQINNQTNHTPG